MFLYELTQSKILAHEKTRGAHASLRSNLFKSLNKSLFLKRLMRLPSKLHKKATKIEALPKEGEF